MPPIVLGSRNKKKIGEMVELLAPHGIDVVGIAEFPGVEDVVEDGDTFAANAEKKARETALAVSRWVIAEDSGLCVDALGGAPGIYSARYAGVHGQDAANNEKLLRELADVPDDGRTAHYVCHAVFCDPQGVVRARSEGRCHGRILRDYHGSNGFGYDPLFLVPEHQQTFGQLDAAIKQRISHRAQAFAELIPKIVGMLTDRAS